MQGNDRRCGKFREKTEHLVPLLQRTETDFSDDERVTGDFTAFQSLRQSVVPSTKVLHPQRRIDQDHGDRRARAGRRRATARSPR